MIDCDIHPTMRSLSDLNPALAKRWQQPYRHLSANSCARAWPRPWPIRGCSRPCRARDAWPPNGGLPGSHLPFMQEQHLDPTASITACCSRCGPWQFAAQSRFRRRAQTAVNEWQLADWTGRTSASAARSRCTQEWPEAAVQEIERRAGNRRFRPGVLAAALRPSLWAAGATGRSIAPRRNTGCRSGCTCRASMAMPRPHPARRPITSRSTTTTSSRCRASSPASCSKACSRISRRLQGGTGRRRLCLGSGVVWRLDKHWATMRDEVPHVKRPPSEYIREHIWYTTQPIEEPEIPSTSSI